MQSLSHEAPLAPCPEDPYRQIAGLARILDLAKQLAAEKDLDRLLELITHQACSAVECERASLFLHDEDRWELYTCNMTHAYTLEEIRLPSDQGIVGLVASQRRMVHVAEPYNHPLFCRDFDQRSGFRTRNILAAPLISWNDNKLLGVLYLLNKPAECFNELDAQLLDAFATHAAIALERALLAKHYGEKVRLETSLQVAQQIQRGFLPRKLPAIEGYELAADCRFPDATGGDYYDVLPLAAGRCGLVVADVCGHGLGPSLLMASLRALLRGLAVRETAPESLMTSLGQVLHDDFRQSRRFVTLLYGCLDLSQHCFSYANAGHGPVALHVQARQGRIRSLADDEARGGPLGFFSEESYRSCTPVALEAGDLLVLGSDGLVESCRGGERFGMDRLSEILLDGCRRPVEQVLRKVMEATTAFHERDELDDDLTLLLVRRT